MNARRLAGPALAAALRDSRQRLRRLVDDLDESQWRIPHQAGINPIAWELGHVAWFAEFWTQRGPHLVGSDGFVHAARPARIAGPDETFDSARLPHAQRWDLPTPERAELFARLEAQLAETIAAMPTGDSDAALYFHRLALLHEDMHAEAFCWLRATLGYPAPEGARLRALRGEGVIRLDRASTSLGYVADEAGFAFDNERPSMAVQLEPFEIDSRCVTAGEFCRFVNAGGYDDPDHWPGDAGLWRRQAARSHPARWRLAAPGGEWQQRWFDRWSPLDPNQPVVHVSAYEAQAYCRWVGRRLPTAAEWGHAAATLPADAFDWGDSVWEWTASPFLPYPGFVVGPYKDYSAPWFGDHRELRGGAFATHPRLQDRRYRNFFRPERCDIFAGFRTAH
ncbi:ergothioneine biosynthesis protein EgtB [Aquincola sp. S2]|uniref:Ergothioneine biosynthesis protein EgtB n=1 Tax=Pseudaquabacterium terrae TaxID=2732868 RepID=A0ABX2ET09_9BURK|nr:selenoneine synthase SenA [Aquabacterium terrae]NRF71621.1 ergothioneine biosynthesis protein EgtB [Aquabacterium terrae]